jgi:hypothetical protein
MDFYTKDRTFPIAPKLYKDKTEYLMSKKNSETKQNKGFRP